MPNPATLDQRLKQYLTTAIALEPYKPKRGQQLTASQTKFGGQPYAERGDAWPICGCGQGLTFIMQANLDQCIRGATTEGEDPPLHGQRRSGLFTFFYCHACSSWGDIPPEAKDAWLVRRYPSPSDARAVAIDDRSPKTDRTIPCAVFISPAQSLPDWETINELDPALAAAIGKLNDDEPWSAYEAAVERIAGEQPGGRTQIGGYPSFIQGANFPDCPTCRKAMRLLAQIDSEEAAGFMWGDAGSVYLFDCADHPDKFDMRLQCY
jgi:uncharacterized protein YwqG